MRSTSNPPDLTTGGSSRFSRTFRLEKMPRSSGQIAIPRRAIAFDGNSIVSRPSNRTEPRRCATIPMIDLSVVVFPAPFRPSSVTTSPRRTSNSTPCRMCDSPYQALRSVTLSNGVAPAESGMFLPQIRLHHLRIARHAFVIAFCEDLSALQNGDGLAQVRNDRQIVLHHQHGPIACRPLHQRGDAFDVLLRHARG